MEEPMFTRIAHVYNDCTAVVIGAGGIGGAIIQFLSGSAAQIVVADRDEALLERLAASGGSAKLLVRKLDVRDGSAVAEFFSFIKTTVGTPDYLFYTAGILNTEPFSETTNDLWNLAVSVNLNGAFYCAKGAAELLDAIAPTRQHPPPGVDCRDEGSIGIAGQSGLQCNESWVSRIRQRDGDSTS